VTYILHVAVIRISMVDTTLEYVLEAALLAPPVVGYTSSM